ncbi:TetR/AcrR family transcriptional regulator [Anaerovorax odorimutans]|uniref:TetR/AcrR family transcriptional regulator n=1 Tax=Anaerovorax odorimutans TaxID=109327 RepID=UPI000402A902|nr:TetR/AcrR family transcriptional regulator [Anaerovorax odorimutans]
MNAKEEILIKAIKLFNQFGYESVTMRDIANAMHKSVGNITYHYPKKSDLMSAIGNLIYHDFCSLQLQTKLDIHGLHENLVKMIQFQKQYAFYFTNMIALRKYQSDTVDTADRQLAVREKLIAYYSEVIRNFEEEEIFETLPEKESSRYLAEGIVLIILSWRHTGIPEHEARYEDLLKTIWNVIYPNLTKKGIKQLQHETIMLS